MTTTTLLPANEQTFTIEVAEGDVTKQRYLGKFTCKCVLSLGEAAEVDLIEARMNEGLKDLRQSTRTLHMVLAQLRLRLTAAPIWWTSSVLPGEGIPGKLLKDWNVVAKIFEECMKAEGDWRLAVWGPPEAITTVETSEGEEIAPKEA